MSNLEFRGSKPRSTLPTLPAVRRSDKFRTVSFEESLYEWSVRMARGLLPRLPLRSPKWRAGVAGRVGAVERITEWAGRARDARPLAWFHAPSVGEGLQLRPVIEAVRERKPDLRTLYTYFSPSAESIGERLPVDYADYLPYDVLPEVSAVLEAVRPAVIVFGKSEVWPTLSRLAQERGTRLALVSATVAPNSSRLHPLARRLLRQAYARLDAVGAISEEDAWRLVRLGVSEERIDVTGDARFDQAWNRARSVDRNAPPVSLVKSRGPTLVAGSTWPEGEARLLQALDRLRLRHPSLRAIVAPHEPTPERVAELEHGLVLAGFAVVRLTRLEAGYGRPWQAVVVDRVGALADLYMAGDLAYVGGGYGRHGLHSVLEPAAAGIPIAFGPRHHNAREATELLERRAAVAAADEAALERALDLWLREPRARERAGRAASAYVEERLGAAAKNAELVLRLLG